MQHAFLLYLLASAAIKSTLVLILASVAAAMMRQRSAAARHAVWALGLGGTLLVPLASTLLPTWRVTIPIGLVATMSSGTQNEGLPIIHVSGSAVLGQGVATPSVSASFKTGGSKLPLAQRRTRRFGEDGNVLDGNHPVLALASTGVTLVTASERLKSTPPRASHHETSAWQEKSLSLLLMLWLSGTLLCLMQFGRRAARAAKLIRTSTPLLGAQPLSLLRCCARQLGIDQRVVLVRSPQITTPAVWGVFRPAIAVPTYADAWTAKQWRGVLLHELAHIERRDCLTYGLAEVACAFYWFSPLVWLAKHKLRVERERACDDRVLGEGEHASSYAGQLLFVAYSAGAREENYISAALAMATTSQLEDRVRRILDPALRRSPGTRAASIRLRSLAVCLVFPLAALEPTVGAGPGMTRLVGASTYTRMPLSVSPAVQARSTSPDTVVSKGDDVSWSGSVLVGDTIAINNFAGTVRAVLSQGTRVDVIAHRYARASNPRAVQVQLLTSQHRTTLCAIYPEPQTPRSCDGYDGELHEIHCDGKDCSDARVDWTVRVPAGVYVSMRTISGEISARNLASDVDARSMSGAIDISTEGHASASTMGIARVAMGRTDWSGRLRLSGSRGLIVTLPSTASTEVDATATFGAVQSDFLLQRSGRIGIGTHATGMVGGGGRSLELNALRGGVILRRGKPSPADRKSGAERNSDIRRQTTDLQRVYSKLGDAFVVQAASTESAGSDSTLVKHAGSFRRPDPESRTRHPGSAVRSAIHRSVENTVRNEVHDAVQEAVILRWLPHKVHSTADLSQD